MSSSLPLSFPLAFRHHRHNSHSFLFNFSSLSPSFSTSLRCFSSPNSSDFQREEIRWLREEQRWLREEQRWLREEQQWMRERESLLRQISDLRLQIQALESQISTPAASVSEMTANIGALFQVLKDKNLIAESGSSANPMVLEGGKRDKIEVREEEKQVVVEEIRILERGGRVEEEEKSLKKERRILRVGSEGEEVREMQEALLKLGFYSGEEEMEFSSFSSGTERAVKTWQATSGVPQDGIMTAELLERLFMEPLINKGVSSINADQETASPEKQEENPNGNAVTSVTQISEIQQTVVKEDGATELEVSEHRVFLLGENRWEEPSRLRGKNKPVRSKTTGATAKCLTCRGEGRLMCTECDGTGEPNIEPQFLEWVDEGAKCPYCAGLGYVVCDVCEGKTLV